MAGGGGWGGRGWWGGGGRGRGAGSRWRARGQAAQADGRLSLGLKAGTHSRWIYKASLLPNSSLILSLPLCSSNSFLFYLPTTSQSVFPQPQTVPLSIPSPFPTFRSLLNQTLPDITTTKAERWGCFFFFFAPCHRTLSIFLHFPIYLVKKTGKLVSRQLLLRCVYAGFRVQAPTPPTSPPRSPRVRWSSATAAPEVGWAVVLVWLSSLPFLTVGARPGTWEWTRT